MTVGASERRRAVRERYRQKAIEEDHTSCCNEADHDASQTPGPSADAHAEICCAVGYDEDELDHIPDGANLGLGCGNPVAMASLAPGETVIDLGSGAGIDCFLAAGRVGPRGRVIGVDMTPEMVERARANQSRGGFGNVEFRLGEIEALPVRDGVADAVISNCVLNLSADRPRVLAEAHRVLRPGGRLMISDMVSETETPAFVAASKELLVGCLPVPVAEYERDLSRAGVEQIRVEKGSPYPAEPNLADPQVQAVIRSDPARAAETRTFAESIHGGAIQAVKPSGPGNAGDK